MTDTLRHLTQCCDNQGDKKGPVIGMAEGGNLLKCGDVHN